MCMTSLPPSNGKGPVDGIGGTMKRLVSHEVMSGKAEVTTSSEFASRSLTGKESIFCLKNQQNLG